MGKKKDVCQTNNDAVNYQYDKRGKKSGPAKTGSYDYVAALLPKAIAIRWGQGRVWG